MFPSGDAWTLEPETVSGESMMLNVLSASMTTTGTPWADEDLDLAPGCLRADLVGTCRSRDETRPVGVRSRSRLLSPPERARTFIAMTAVRTKGKRQQEASSEPKELLVKLNWN